MCLLTKCCCLAELSLGVQIIAAFGVFSAVFYTLLSIFGGGDVFVILAFFDLNYVYLGLVLTLVHFFVHFMLWTGAREKQRWVEQDSRKCSRDFLSLRNF